MYYVPVNTIIAWRINYYHKHEMLINYFIIASRAYSQQSPTCTRVNNLVYIFSIQHPWSLSADHVCLWKRFCPCSVLYSSLCPLQNCNCHLIYYIIKTQDNQRWRFVTLKLGDLNGSDLWTRLSRTLTQKKIYSRRSKSTVAHLPTNT